MGKERGKESKTKSLAIVKVFRGKRFKNIFRQMLAKTQTLSNVLQMRPLSLLVLFLCPLHRRLFLH